MFQKTRIRLTIVNSLVFILLIGVLGSIIYSYTYKRIYNEVDQSIKKWFSIEKNFDDKIPPPRKHIGNIFNWGPKDNRINLEWKNSGDRWRKRQTSFYL